jgi:hypothetical protein
MPGVGAGGVVVVGSCVIVGGPLATILVSAPLHRATPGEPRVCGSAGVAPPFVVTLDVGPDVANPLRAADPRYVLEVEEENFDWHPVEILDWMHHFVRRYMDTCVR